jgi:hypothetical protein
MDEHLLLGGGEGAWVVAGHHCGGWRLHRRAHTSSSIQLDSLFFRFQFSECYECLVLHAAGYC